MWSHFFRLQMKVRKIGQVTVKSKIFDRLHIYTLITINTICRKYPISGKNNGSTINLLRQLNTHPDVVVATVSKEIEIIVD